VARAKTIVLPTSWLRRANIFTEPLTKSFFCTLR
jgi:hypothetical protein